MAGRGPAPKPAGTRARRNAQPVSERVFVIRPGSQPDLPDVMPSGEPWPLETGKWWNMWAVHPIAAEFSASDWLFLKDTAVLHGAYWSGDMSVAGELRLRVAKFGATPEDRARLRVTFAIAETSEQKAQQGRKAPAKKATSARGKKPADPRLALASS